MCSSLDGSLTEYAHFFQAGFFKSQYKQMIKEAGGGEGGAGGEGGEGGEGGDGGEGSDGGEGGEAP